MTKRRRSRVSRRSLLKGAALGAAAVAVNPILATRSVLGAGEGIPGRFMVVVNMLGGCDGLNMVVPTHLSPYVDRRAAINLVNEVGSGGGLPVGEVLPDLDGDWKLHYSLGAIKSIWDDNDLHIVNRVSYPTPNQSHFTSQDIYSFGVRNNTQNGDGRGWLGRFADEFCADPVEPLGVISVGLGRRVDFNSDVTQPMILRDVPGFTVDADNNFPGNQAHRLSTVRGMLDADPIPTVEPRLSIFNTNQLAYDLVDRVQDGVSEWVDPGDLSAGNPNGYPDTTLGRYMRTVSQLLSGQATFGTKVFYTGFGGFDNHSNQIVRHASLMDQLNGAIRAFSTDMKNINKWNDCVIVVISEFGRRIFENGSFGTDHGHGNAFFVMGGRVKGRLDVGSGMTAMMSEANLQPPNSTVPFGIDFRDIYLDVIGDHLGVTTNSTQLFPDPDFQPDPSGLGLV